MSAFASISPRVDFAFLCDAAGGGEGGKLDAAGIGIDTFTATQLPALLPLLLVARLSGSGLPEALTARVVDADGSTLLEQAIRGREGIPALGRPAKLPLLAHLFVPVARTGEFQLDVFNEHELLHSIAFWVEAA